MALSTGPTGEDTPGVLYDGDGMPLAGNDKLPFKAVLPQRRRLGDGGQLGIGDRLRLLPDTLGTPPGLPGAVLGESVGVIRSGNVVGLAARDASAGAGALVRDALPLPLDEGEGQP